MKRFRYCYEYSSPFGENWRVDFKLFGLIWIPFDRPYHLWDSFYNSTKIEEFVAKLERAFRIKKIRKNGISTKK